MKRPCERACLQPIPDQRGQKVPEVTIHALLDFVPDRLCLRVYHYSTFSWLMMANPAIAHTTRVYSGMLEEHRTNHFD
ncbi:hypothetical protein Pelo_8426 [Pelomyxa schiedti]|nr:hypothetical protein Pelo_8426 [Pelomyxa schiedti]